MLISLELAHLAESSPQEQDSDQEVDADEPMSSVPISQEEEEEENVLVYSTMGPSPPAPPVVLAPPPPAMPPQSVEPYEIPPPPLPMVADTKEEDDQPPPAPPAAAEGIYDGISQQTTEGNANQVSVDKSAEKKMDWGPTAEHFASLKEDEVVVVPPRYNKVCVSSV